MNRQERAVCAQHTLNIIKNKSYKIIDSKNNSTVFIGPLLDNSYNESLLLKEDDERIKLSVLDRKFEESAKISVINESVVDMIIKDNSVKYGVLCFASAYNPGGGFLNGSMAQEEALCYCSNLSDVLNKHFDNFYNYNRQIKNKCYSDRMIYSKDIVFFRSGNMELLNNVFFANVLSVPAVNLRAARNQGLNEVQCYVVMKNRMRKILSVFSSMNNAHIILGAFGCGVFRNDPQKIAELWKELLEEGWKYHFKEVIFAVYDTTSNQETFKLFKTVFKDVN